jgi:hypothetical protein
MALSVITQEPRVDAGNETLVILQGDSIDEVTSLQAKQAALQDARQRGFVRPGIAGSTGPYPVDENGEDASGRVAPGMKYRNDYRVSMGLG